MGGNYDLVLIAHVSVRMAIEASEGIQMLGPQMPSVVPRSREHQPATTTGSAEVRIRQAQLFGTSRDAASQDLGHLDGRAPSG